MPLTQPQVLALWLVATSARPALAAGDPDAIPLNDNQALLNQAGIDVNQQPDVQSALTFLQNNSDKLLKARQLFVSMINSVGYTPPHCPPSGQLRALSTLAPE